MKEITYTMMRINAYRYNTVYFQNVIEIRALNYIWTLSLNNVDKAVYELFREILL